jgi:hypothetical protein
VGGCAGGGGDVGGGRGVLVGVGVEVTGGCQTDQLVVPVAASQFHRWLPVSSTGGCQSV